MYTAKLSAVHSGSEVGITGKMLLDACASTRPSTSRADRARFLAIYADFRDASGASGDKASGDKDAPHKSALSSADGEAQELLGKLAKFGYDASVKRLATA